MAWVVYLKSQTPSKTFADVRVGPDGHWLLLMEASGPRDERARSSLWGMPILAAWGGYEFLDERMW